MKIRNWLAAGIVVITTLALAGCGGKFRILSNNADHGIFCQIYRNFLLAAVHLSYKQLRLIVLPPYKIYGAFVTAHHVADHISFFSKRFIFRHINKIVFCTFRRLRHVFFLSFTSASGQSQSCDYHYASRQPISDLRYGKSDG